MARQNWARSTTTRARAGKTAPAETSGGRSGRPGRTGGAQEAITGFIRTLEKLDAAASRATAGPTQNKAAARAPEGKSGAPEGK